MSPVQDKPLSPHLQVYRPQLTSVTSILHRMTGGALAIGILPFLWWLGALAYGPEAYALFRMLWSAWYGQVMLFGWLACFCYHFCNGIRHLLWDMGLLLKLKQSYIAGYLVLAATVILTGSAWYCLKYMA